MAVTRRDRQRPDQRHLLRQPAALFPQAGIKPSGIHIFRHTAAKLRRDDGERIEDVSRFLDHSSLGVTTVYMRRLEGEQDKSWGKVAAAIGV